MDFNQLNFKYHWRAYQQRVLDAIDEHLDDSKLHIVAAPGAGKTTLGIEVFKRLEKKALVLSPSRVIRDQWIDRLKDFVDLSELIYTRTPEGRESLLKAKMRAFSSTFAKDMRRMDKWQ